MRRQLTGPRRERVEVSAHGTRLMKQRAHPVIQFLKVAAAVLVCERADDVFDDGGVLGQSFKERRPGMERLRQIGSDQVRASLYLLTQFLEGHALRALMSGIKPRRRIAHQINRVAESFNQARVEERALS